MKLLDVFLRPITGDYVSAVLVLEHEGAKVEKVVRWVGAVEKAFPDGRRSEVLHQVFRVIREAERDAAFILHGEAWRAHVGKFWRDASDDDRAFAREVADRVDRLMAPDCEKRQAFAPVPVRAAGGARLSQTPGGVVRLRVVDWPK